MSIPQSIPQSLSVPWTRKHDKPGTPHIPQARLVVFPRSLEDLIVICSTRDPHQRLHAAGSHWALSRAAVSDDTFIETHDYNNIRPAMGRTLFDVVGRGPDGQGGCLADGFLSNLDATSRAANTATEYYVHFESGKRIYQLYSELDMGDSHQAQSLCQLMDTTRFKNNTLFQGSWGFHTLGGAGGQTVVGALSTGTHGGDFDRPPLADDVVALHLVADGGKHYWIEKGRSATSIPFTDEAKLRDHYGQAQFGGPKNFCVIYDDDAWKAAIIQVGRFGVVYSAVLRVYPQYGLRQTTTQTDWEKVRISISDHSSNLFTESFTSPISGNNYPQQFLQIAINPVPSHNGTTHICGVTKHWTIPLKEVPPSPQAAVVWPTAGNVTGAGNVAGRPERVGKIVLDPDPLLNAPRFANAGASVPYTPDESGVTSFSFQDSACQDASFFDGVVSGIYTEIEDFLSSNTVAIGGALAGAIAAGAGPGLIALASFLVPILALLAIFLDLLRNAGSTAGQALNDLRGALLLPPPLNLTPQGVLGIWIWRAIAAGAFTSLLPKDCSAISYAVLDAHDYTDISCAVNVRSVEVFFDAADPTSRANLIAFVDRLLQFEADQEFEAGKSVAGYISLRFSNPSAALIAPGPFPRTVAVECSGLADEAGSADFVNFAAGLALDPNIKGNLHWGQQNDSTQQEIEFRFGDAPNSPTGPLHTWRSILSRLTDNGRNEGFSSDFTRGTGLEIVQPQIGSFVVTTAPSSTNSSCTITWVCISNPPETTIGLDIAPPSAVVTSIAGLPLNGSHTFDASGSGTYVVTLRASLERNGVTRTASQKLSVQVGPVVG